MTSESTSSGLSTMNVAEITVGVAVCTAFLAAAYFYWRWMRRRERFFGIRLRRVVDPEEEFVSRGPSLRSLRGRGYGHGQQPSVSLQPLLVSSPPPTHASQDMLAVPGSPQQRDWSYLPSPVDPVLPLTMDPGHFSLYEVEDPFARIERVSIVPTSPLR